MEISGLQSKIRDAELREFAAGVEVPGDASRSVIVEAANAVAPREKPVPRLSNPLPTDPYAKKPAKIVDYDSANRRSLDELEQAVMRLKPQGKPVRLEAAQALVMDVTPEQLVALVKLPMVTAIRPNRVHRVPSSQPEPAGRMR